MGTTITFRRGENDPTSGSGLTLAEPAFNTTLKTFHIGLGYGITAAWVGAPISGLSADIAAGITYKISTAAAVKNYIGGLCYGNTGAPTITQYVSSFNGLTGAVGGVCAAQANTFTALQSFANGISASGITVNGNMSVTGNFTVSGGVTFTTSETVLIEDNIITLNSNVTGSPSENAGIEIERGTSANVQLLWNESSDKWTFTNDGSTYYDLPTSVVSSITVSGGSTYTGAIEFVPTTYIGIRQSQNNLEFINDGVRTFNGSTGAITFTNYVSSFNGSTGAVTGASLGANTFTGLNTFTAGLCAAGATVSGNIRFLGTESKYISTTQAPLTISGTSSGPIALGSNSIRFGVQSNDPLTITSITGVVNISTDRPGFPVQPALQFNTDDQDLIGPGFIKIEPTTYATGNRTQYLQDASGTLALTSQLMGAVNGSTAATTAVTSFNGLTGAVGGVCAAQANTFTALQSFNSGISSAGGTFTQETRFASGLSASTVKTLNLSGYGGLSPSFIDGRFRLSQFMGTFTTVQSSGSTDRTITLPDADGTVALTSQLMGAVNGSTAATTAVTSFNGRTGAVQGVSAAAAGDGIAVSGATGAVTITNTGVTRAVAGTGISVSGATGSVTITNIGVQSFNGNTGAVTGVSSVNGATGAVTNVAKTNEVTNFSAASNLLTVTDTTSVRSISISPSAKKIVFTDDDFGNDVQLFVNSFGNQVITFPDSTCTLAGRDISQTFTSNNTFTSLQTFSAGICAAGATFSGNISAPNIVTSFNGLTGAVQGVSAAVAGTGISVSGATGAVTITNTGVQTFNGLTGAVTGVTVGGVNTFTQVNTFSAGISAAGSTFASTANTLDVIASTEGAGLRIARATSGAGSRIGGIRLGRSATSSLNTYLEGSSGTFSLYNGVDNTGTLFAAFSPTQFSLGTTSASFITLNSPNIISFGDTSAVGNNQVFSISGTARTYTFGDSTGVTTGFVGINRSGLCADYALEVNSPTGKGLQLIYNDHTGAASNWVNMDVSSGGNFTVRPSGGLATVTGTLNVSAGISAAGGVTFGGTVASDTGYRITSNAINAQTGTTYTFLDSDNGKIVTFSNASAVTVTIPTALPVGFHCTAIQLGAGQVGFTAASGVTMQSYGGQYRLIGQHASASVIEYTTNIVNLSGNLVV